MENLGKNLDKRIDNLRPVPFTKENQPSPEAKKKGWERRREAQKIMDEIMQLADMPYADIKALLEDIKVHPESHTLREVKLAQYLMDKKYTVDYLDRHVPKAPQDVNLGGDLEIKITREVINGPKTELS